jgi:hypothetical protein
MTGVCICPEALSLQVLSVSLAPLELMIDINVTALGEGRIETP